MVRSGECEGLLWDAAASILRQWREALLAGLWAVKKAVGSNRAAWLFMFAIGHVPKKCLTAASCSDMIVIKLVSHKDE